MPVPRAARLASRKSVIPDPSLYGDLSDDSDEDPTPVRSNQTTIKTTSNSTSNRPRKSSVAPKSNSTVVNGKKKVARSSTESLEEEEERNQSSSRSFNDSRHSNDQEASNRSKQSNSKRRRVEKESDEEMVDQQEEEDHSSRTTATLKPTKVKSTSKRPKTEQRMSEEQQAEPEPASQTSQASSQKKGNFVPRAAASQATRPNKPPPKFSAVLDGSDDDEAPFLFTTNPPTPHAPGAAKRAATKPKQNPKGKAPRIQPPAEQSEDQQPVASTSRVKLTPPRPNDSANSVPITTHETPVNIRNVAFRQGVGPGTPSSTVGKSDRRNSNGSARRGSSIGGGFTGTNSSTTLTATPHPEIKNEELWRSTDPLLPIASRTRTIISWATQRDRTRLFGEGSGSKRLNDTEQVAKEVIDDFIEGICNLSIDTSVPFRQAQKPKPTELPPHPQNVANSAKKSELQEEFGAIAEEQNSRQSTSAIYSAFSTRRSTAREALSTLPLTHTLDAVSIAETFDLSRPGPKSLEEALEMGKTLLEEADAKASGEGAKKKDRRKSRAKAEDEDNGEIALDSQIRGSLEDTAHLQQLTHRLSGFTRVVSRFISHRSAETHQALRSHSLQGLESTTATGGTTGSQDSSSATGGAGLSSVVGVVGTSTSIGGGLDPLDLLRAISRADTNRR